jgi:hypothetical protein
MSPHWRRRISQDAQLERNCASEEMREPDSSPKLITLTVRGFTVSSIAGDSGLPSAAQNRGQLIDMTGANLGAPVRYAVHLIRAW